MEKEFLINAGNLAGAIKTLKPFISKEETRYYLGGIYFELDEGSNVLNMVATDGIKLCVLNVPADRRDEFDDELKVIIPDKALNTMLVMLKNLGADFPISLRFDEAETKVFVDAGDEKAEFRLIDGTFPDYKKVIPTEKPKFTIGFGKVQAREALKAISTHTSKTEGLAWDMTDEKSAMVIRADSKLIVVMPMRVKLPGETEIGVEAKAS